MKAHFNLALLLLALLFACAGEQAAQSNAYLVSGKLINLSNQPIYLYDLSQQRAAAIDTAQVDQEGNFSFDYQPAEMGFYRLNFSNNAAIILPLGPNKGAVVNGDVSDFQNLDVSGSAEAKTLSEFNQFNIGINNELNQLNTEFQAIATAQNVDSLRPIFQEKAATIEQRREEKIKSILDNDPGSFANLAIIEQLSDAKAENLDYFMKVNEAIGKNYGTSIFYQSLKRKVDNLTRFAPGTQVPEINLPDPEGNYVPLSSLRGQVVLIDFWASWCKPCRFENPNVVAAYNKYKDKGFTVYGVSLDRTKDAWVKAIAQDQLTWTHVSDLKFWQSEAAQAYGVSGIPFALLIDQEGKVIGKNLRGAALHQKLAEVLN